MRNLSYLRTRMLVNHKERVYNSGSGTLGHYITYLLKGHGVFHINGQDIPCEPGQMVYTPKGLSYYSTWHNDGDIEIFSFAFDFFSSSKEPVYGFKVFDPDEALSAERFEEILRLHERQGLDELRAIGLFYQLYADVAEHLTPQSVSPGYTKLLPALGYLETNVSSYRIDNAKLADMCFMSQSSFYSTFRKEMGYTPVEYKNLLLVRQAVHLLVTTDDSLQTIAQKLGFSTPAYLRRVILHFTGLLPSAIRENGDMNL